LWTNGFPPFWTQKLSWMRTYRGDQMSLWKKSPNM
jgi:hypothetical protein